MATKQGNRSGNKKWWCGERNERISCNSQPGKVLPPPGKICGKQNKKENTGQF